MIARFSIFPIDKGINLSKYVAEVLSYIDKQSKTKTFNYQLTSMGTIIEGEFDVVWNLIKDAHHLLSQKSDRVYLTIEIDDRKNIQNGIVGKVKRVKRIIKKKKFHNSKDNNAYLATEK